jgi:MFS superfamily sulfate permease-like transporter
MAVAGAAVALLGLDEAGVATIGPVPRGLPSLGLPGLPAGRLAEVLPEVLAAAAGIALVSFSSAMLTARSFAAKNHYDIDVDREFSALGAANIASALSQGFAVSGADSRTAMNDASGGQTRVAGLVAAASVSLVLLFLTAPLRFVPIAALGAVLIRASASLMDLSSLRRFWVLDKLEFLLSVTATLGVVWVGAIQAILIAVLLALGRFVRLAARPHVEVLGQVPGEPGLHSIDRHPGAETVPGLVLFRFNGPLVFFNAPHFKRQALAAVEGAGPGLEWFVLDMMPLTQLDVTGMDALRELDAELERRGVLLVAAGRRLESAQWLEARGLLQPRTMERLFPTLRAAVKAYRAKQGVLEGTGAPAPPSPSPDPMP